MAHHDGASQHAGGESAHFRQHEDPERGGCAMMLDCAVTSGEPLLPADIRSFPGVAFQAGPFVQQAPPSWHRTSILCHLATTSAPVPGVSLGCLSQWRSIHAHTSTRGNRPCRRRAGTPLPVPAPAAGARATHPSRDGAKRGTKCNVGPATLAPTTQSCLHRAVVLLQPDGPSAGSVCSRR